MKKALITYLLFTVLSEVVTPTVFGQPYTGPADSLENILEKKLSDTLRVDALNALASVLHSTDYERAVETARSAAELSAAIAYRFGEAKAYQNIALSSWANGRYNDALASHKKAIDMFVTHGFDGELAEAYNKLGLVHFYIAGYDKATDFLNKSVERYRVKKDTGNLARVLNNLGLVYDTRGEYGISTKYFIESLQLNLNFRQLRDQQNRTYGRSMIHENEFINDQVLEDRLKQIEKLKSEGPTYQLAHLYVEIAEAYYFLKEMPKAIPYYELALTNYEQLHDPVFMGHCLRDLAECYEALEDYGKALDLFQQAAEVYRKKKNYIRYSSVVAQIANLHYLAGEPEQSIEWHKRSIALEDSLMHRAALSKSKAIVAGVLAEQNQLDEALTYAREAYETAVEIGSKLRIELAARRLYEVLKARGETAEALAYLEESARLRQEFDDELTNREVAELQIEFETSKKQEQIDQLSQIASLNASVLGLQKQMIVLLSLSLLAIAVLLVFVNGRLRKIKKLNTSIDGHRTQILEQNKVLERRGREKELLIGEIHHRVKNNLQIISSLLRLQQRNMADDSARVAFFEGQNRVQSMSLLHQRLYQQGTHESVDLKSYTQDILDHLLRVYKVSRSEIDVNAACDPISLNVDTAVTFGLVINEVYSNIFKHAYRQGRHLAVSFEARQKDNEVVVTVADNGPGFPAGVEKVKGNFGLNLIRMMVGELNGRAAFDNLPKGGALVTIAFADQDGGTAD